LAWISNIEVKQRAYPGPEILQRPKIPYKNSYL